jgi:CRISPR-associated protein Cas1
MSWRKRALAARHPINAMLNYGYAVLKAKVRSEVVAAGFDPSIGLMHGNSSSSLPLVYDLMEPLRPVVDARILEFALANTFAPDDFTINRIGACRLHPQLARKVVQHADIATWRENDALSRLITY